MRTATLSCLLALCLAATALAQKPPPVTTEILVTGTVKEVGRDYIVVTDFLDGRDVKMEVVIRQGLTVNGKPARLSDVKPGMRCTARGEANRKLVRDLKCRDD